VLLRTKGPPSFHPAAALGRPCGVSGNRVSRDVAPRHFANATTGLRHCCGDGSFVDRSPECATYQTRTVRFRTAWPNRHRSGGAHGILRPSQRVLCAGPAAFLPDQPTCRFSIACCRCFSRRTRRFLLLNLHLSAKSKAFAAAPGRSRTQLRLSMFLRSRTAMGFSSSRSLRHLREINRGARRSGSRHL